MSKKKAKTPTQGKEVPIKWNISDNIITRFASNMVVQTLENEFKISFFEIKPEIRLKPPEKLPTEVKADCVASIIVATKKFPQFIDALRLHYDQYIKSESKK